MLAKLKKLYKFMLRGYKADSNTYIKYLRKIGCTIGENCWFHDPATTFIDTDKPYMIEIGDNVHITRNCTIVAHGYDWIVLKNLYGENFGSSEKVSIGNNVFLGMDTTVLKGVTIGDNVIIGAGSLVTKDIEGNCVAAGRPAKKIMSLEDYKNKRRNQCLSEAVDSYNRLVDKGMFDKIKENWEFKWIYDEKQKIMSLIHLMSSNHIVNYKRIKCVINNLMILKRGKDDIHNNFFIHYFFGTVI